MTAVMSRNELLQSVKVGSECIGQIFISASHLITDTLKMSVYGREGERWGTMVDGEPVLRCGYSISYLISRFYTIAAPHNCRNQSQEKMYVKVLSFRFQKYKDDNRRAYWRNLLLSPRIKSQQSEKPIFQ